MEQQKVIFKNRQSKKIKIEELQFIDYDTLQEEREKELLGNYNNEYIIIRVERSNK